MTLIQNSLNQKKLNNLKNKNLIGKFFMDHPKFNLGYLKFPKYEIIDKFKFIKKNNLIFYYGISLQKKFSKKK